MAVKTLWAHNAISDGDESTALLESSPGSEAGGLGGWTVGTNAPTRYKEPDLGGEVPASGWSTSPLPNGVLGAWDSMRAGPFTGRFQAGDWTFVLAVRADTSGGDQDGGVSLRMHRGAAADGSGATEVTSGVVNGTAVTNLTTAATQVSTATITLPELDIVSEYIWVELAWRITGAGGAANRDVLIRHGGASGTRLVTTDFGDIPSGGSGPPVGSLALLGVGR